MNFLAIFLAVIALANKHMQRIFQLFLSSITAYWAYKLNHPTVYLLDPNTYTLEQVQDWVADGYAFKAILYTSVCYGFFYFGLRLILVNLIHAPLEKLLKRIFLKISQQDFRIVEAFMVRKMRKFIRWCVAKGIIKRGKNNDPVSYTEYVEDVYSTFCITIHIIVCWFALGINDYIGVYILAGIVALILVIQILCFPLTSLFYKSASKVIEHEAALMQKNLI